MIRVAIETSTPQGSVAVGRGDRVLAEVTLGMQRRHAELAVPALEAALRLAGVERSAIGAVVVGAGPGSFTGVRVAGATAKGLVAALDVPLLAYSSLLALAVSVPSDGPVCALFDARRGEVYAGCWEVGDRGEPGAPGESETGSLAVVLEPRVGPADDLVRALGGRPLFAGDGAARYADVIREHGGRVAASPAWPRASALLWLAEHYGGAGAVEDVAGWEPSYVRASSAERGVAG